MLFSSLYKTRHLIIALPLASSIQLIRHVQYSLTVYNILHKNPTGKVLNKHCVKKSRNIHAYVCTCMRNIFRLLVITNLCLITLLHNKNTKKCDLQLLPIIIFLRFSLVPTYVITPYHF